MSGQWPLDCHLVGRAYLAGLRGSDALGIGRQLRMTSTLAWAYARRRATHDVWGCRRRAEQRDQDCGPCRVSGTLGAGSPGGAGPARRFMAETRYWGRGRSSSGRRSYPQRVDSCANKLRWCQPGRGVGVAPVQRRDRCGGGVTRPCRQSGENWREREKLGEAALARRWLGLVQAPDVVALAA